MRLNGSVNKELIEICLKRIEMYFETGFSEEEETKKLVYEKYYKVVNAHATFFQDPESMIELIVEYFLKPLKNIIPESILLAPTMRVEMVKNKFVYTLEIISKLQMSKYLQCF